MGGSPLILIKGCLLAAYAKPLKKGSQSRIIVRDDALPRLQGVFFMLCYRVKSEVCRNNFWRINKIQVLLPLLHQTNVLFAAIWQRRAGAVVCRNLAMVTCAQFYE